MPDSAATPDTPDVSAIEQVIAEAPQVFKEAKAGYRTTEFWLTVAWVIASQLQVLHLPSKYGDVSSIAAVVAYVLSRGIAKKGVPHVES
jgi:hypothetical protein